MSPSAELWTTLGLLDHFMHVHHEMQDRAFAFVLGAGASKSSGIPTGAELVHQWLAELHHQLDPRHGTRRLQDWATAAHLGIPGFTFPLVVGMNPLRTLLGLGYGDRLLRKSIVIFFLSPGAVRWNFSP